MFATVSARLAAAAACLAAFSCAAQAAAYDASTLHSLARLKRGEHAQVDAFPAGPTRRASIRFERVDVYAPEARVYEVTAQGPREIPRSTRVFLRGYSDDGRSRVALALEADGSFAAGSGAGEEGDFALVEDDSQRGVLGARRLDAMLPAPDAFDFRCGNEGAATDAHALLGTPAGAATLDVAGAIAAANGATASATVTLRSATVAIDTDRPFMTKLFADDKTKATNWIAAMFNTMNVMYERDLAVKLLQGTTYLCGSGCSDPYTAATDIPADTKDLNVFGAYWKANHAGVSRTFAALLSGQEASTSNSCSASGIAWIDAYCQNGTASGSNTFGSYSVNQVCTSINIDPNATFNARLVGHELGHNFGAAHTHCTNATTGAYDTATNTIDKCYNAESGCYSGAGSCPAAGAGTIMSYCNLTSVSGCANGTQNLLQFHPTQIATLTSLIAQAPLSCMASGTVATDDIFIAGFQ